MKTEIDLTQHTFDGIFQHQISDHPATGLVRVINYRGANIREDFNVIEHIGEMHYFNADSKHLPEFTHKVKQNGKDWKVDNSYEVIERNPDGTPKLDEEGEEIKHPAFDYFLPLIFSISAPLETILKSSIDLDDAYKLFD
ncbi:hypothetical protein GO491_03055 [Flavobacteriaceae bacterium Ap0902]|nr:hypothetical protein [Flavobacteriaceae bacterium Ap0902]